MPFFPPNPCSHKKSSPFDDSSPPSQAVSFSLQESVLTHHVIYPIEKPCYRVDNKNQFKDPSQIFWLKLLTCLHCLLVNGYMQQTSLWLTHLPRHITIAFHNLIILMISILFTAKLYIYLLYDKWTILDLTVIETFCFALFPSICRGDLKQKEINNYICIYSVQCKDSTSRKLFNVSN